MVTRSHALSGRYRLSLLVVAHGPGQDVPAVRYRHPPGGRKVNHSDVLSLRRTQTRHTCRDMTAGLMTSVNIWYTYPFAAFWLPLNM